MKEIAKIAQEKGFKAKTVTTSVTFKYWLGEGKNLLINDTCNYLLLCEIQRWIREELNAYITVITDNLNSYTVIIYDKLRGTRYIYTENLDQDDVDYHTFQDIKEFVSYEEALELSIKETLKNEQ